MKTAYNIAYIAGIYAFVSPLIVGPPIIIALNVLQRNGVIKYKETTEDGHPNTVTPGEVLIAFSLLLTMGPHALAAIDITATVICTICLSAILLIGYGHTWAMPISLACLWLGALIWGVRHVDRQLKNPMLEPTPMNLLRVIAATTKNKTTS